MHGQKKKWRDWFEFSKLKIALSNPTSSSKAQERWVKKGFYPVFCGMLSHWVVHGQMSSS